LVGSDPLLRWPPSGLQFAEVRLSALRVNPECRRNTVPQQRRSLFITVEACAGQADV